MEHYSNFVQFDFLELGRFAWSPSAESEGKYEITHWGKAKKIGILSELGRFAWSAWLNFREN